MANPFAMKSASNLMPGEWEAQQQDIQDQRKYAELLRQQSLEGAPQGSMVSGIYVAPSITQNLAHALKGWQARQANDQATEQEKRLGLQMQQELTNWINSKPTDKPALTTQPDTDESGASIAQRTIPAVQATDQERMAWALRGLSNPLSAGVAGIEYQRLATPKVHVVGRTLMDESGKQLGVDSTWQAEQQAARAEKAKEAEAALQARREIADQASADRRMIAGMVNARQEQKNTPKLPTSALKMQQEELDAIGTSGSINADLGALEKQIDSGKLQLGPVNNLLAKGKNLIGASDEASRNLASFQSTLEKLRNDSLRLNKGVQTEGDAQRAWNELVSNINDPKVVKQRLGEIQKINERAANLRRMNVDNIRANFGVEPMDVGAYKNQPAAVGGGGGFRIIGVQ